MVHAYVRGADGNYASAGTLPAPDVAGSQFGAALAIAGDMAYVGAPGEGSGVVHVFRHTTTGWADAGTLSAAGLDAEAAFGSAIAVAGNRIAVGAPRTTACRCFVRTHPMLRPSRAALMRSCSRWQPMQRFAVG